MDLKDKTCPGIRNAASAASEPVRLLENKR